MLRQTFNAVVRHTLAATAEEVEEVLADLPASVSQGLAHELQIAGDVHRYDLAAQRAYYFEKQGDELAVWSWNEVRYHHEAGELIALVVASRAPLDEELANAFYVCATGRTVEQVPNNTVRGPRISGAAAVET